MALILIGFALLALIDLIPLIRKHSGRGVAVFLLIFIMALSLSVLQAAGVEVPSVMLFLDDIVQMLGTNYQ